MCKGRQTGLHGWRVRILVRLELGDESIHRGAESKDESEPTLLMLRNVFPQATEGSSPCSRRVTWRAVRMLAWREEGGRRWGAASV